jgi:hypothetical protein
VQGVYGRKWNRCKVSRGCCSFRRRTRTHLVRGVLEGDVAGVAAMPIRRVGAAGLRLSGLLGERRRPLCPPRLLSHPHPHTQSHRPRHLPPTTTFPHRFAIAARSTSVRSTRTTDDRIDAAARTSLGLVRIIAHQRPPWARPLPSPSSCGWIIYWLPRAIIPLHASSVPRLVGGSVVSFRISASLGGVFPRRRHTKDTASRGRILYETQARTLSEDRMHHLLWSIHKYASKLARCRYKCRRE